MQLHWALQEKNGVWEIEVHLITAYMHIIDLKLHQQTLPCLAHVHLRKRRILVAWNGSHIYFIKQQQIGQSRFWQFCDHACRCLSLTMTMLADAYHSRWLCLPMPISHNDYACRCLSLTMTMLAVAYQSQWLCLPMPITHDDYACRCLSLTMTMITDAYHSRWLYLPIPR